MRYDILSLCCEYHNHQQWRSSAMTEEKKSSLSRNQIVKLTQNGNLKFSHCIHQEEKSLSLPIFTSSLFSMRIFQLLFLRFFFIFHFHEVEHIQCRASEWMTWGRRFLIQGFAFRDLSFVNFQSKSGIPSHTLRLSIPSLAAAAASPPLYPCVNNIMLCGGGKNSKKTTINSLLVCSTYHLVPMSVVRWESSWSEFDAHSMLHIGEHREWTEFFFSFCCFAMLLQCHWCRVWWIWCNVHVARCSTASNYPQIIVWGAIIGIMRSRLVVKR